MAAVAAPRYVSVTTVDALTGYWVCARDPVTLTVRGLAPNRLDLPLHAGWNLVGPPREMVAPGAAAVAKPVCGWDGASYRDVVRVSPGAGYWIYCQTPLTWRFGE